MSDNTLDWKPVNEHDELIRCQVRLEAAQEGLEDWKKKYADIFDFFNDRCSDEMAKYLGEPK